MSDNLQLVAIIGSLRVESSNRYLFEAAAELLDPGVSLTEVSLRDVPLYNGDVEQAGDPDSVAAMKSAVDAADGLIVFTPEYNRSIPAVTKNAIDWLSRVPGSSVLSRTTVGIVGATPGRHEIAGVRAHLADCVGVVTKSLYGTSLGIASVTRAVENGRLTDPGTRQDLTAWLSGFVEFVREQRS